MSGCGTCLEIGCTDSRVRGGFCWLRTSLLMTCDRP